MTAPSCSRSEALIRNSGLSSASKTATVPFAVPAASHRPVGSAARHVPGSGNSRVWSGLPSFRDRTATCDPTRTASLPSASTASAVGVAASFAPRGFGCLSGRGRLVDLGVAAGDPERLAVGGQGHAALRQRVEPEGQLVGVEAVEAGGLALGVDGDERHRAADADDRLGGDVAAIGQVLLDDHGATPSAVEAQLGVGVADPRHGHQARGPLARRRARS